MLTTHLHTHISIYIYTVYTRFCTLMYTGCLWTVASSGPSSVYETLAQFLYASILRSRQPTGGGFRSGQLNRVHWTEDCFLCGHSALQCAGYRVMAHTLTPIWHLCHIHCIRLYLVLNKGTGMTLLTERWLWDILRQCIFTLDRYTSFKQGNWNDPCSRKDSFETFWDIFTLNMCHEGSNECDWILTALCYHTAVL